MSPAYIKAPPHIKALLAAKKDIARFLTRGAVDYDALFQASKSWSSSERAFVKLSAHLYNPRTYPVTIDDVFSALDEENTRKALKILEEAYCTG